MRRARGSIQNSWFRQEHQLCVGPNYLALSIILINIFTFCKMHRFKQITKASGRTHSHFWVPDLLKYFLSPWITTCASSDDTQNTLWVIRERTLIFNGERVIASFRTVSLLLPLFRPSAQTIQIHHFLISLVNSVRNWFFFPPWWFWTGDFPRE